MAQLTKRQKATAGKVDSNKLYPLDGALALVKECATAKFDESIDVAVQLGIDAKKSDQVVRGAVVLPVVITAFADKSFTFVMKSPPASVLLKKAAKLDKGSAKPHVDKVGKLTRAQVEEIAKTKIKDLTAADMDAAIRTIAGSARSMGITVEGI